MCSNLLSMDTTKPFHIEPLLLRFVIAACVIAALFFAVAPSIASAVHCPTGFVHHPEDATKCVVGGVIDKADQIAEDEFFKDGPGKALLGILKGFSVALILFGAWHANKSFRGGGGAAKGIQLFVLYLILALFLFDLTFTLRIMKALGGLIETVLGWGLSLFTS